MNRAIILMLSFLLLSVAGADAQTSRLQDTSDSQYKAGQVWRYWTRPNEKGSTFIVLKTEKHPTLRTIVHIAVSGVKIKSPDGQIIEKIPDLPMTEFAIESSGAKLVSENAVLPDYGAAYRRWRQAFDAGYGFVYANTIAGALEEFEVNLNRDKSAIRKTEQRMLSEHPPITLLYSALKDRTDVMVPLAEAPGEMTLFGSLMSTRSGVFLSQAHFDYAGATYPPNTGRETGTLVFIADKKRAYEDPPLFSISVEGQSVFSGESELCMNIGFDHDTKVVDQWITLRMPRAVFLQVATASKVVVKIGENDYEIKDYQAKYLRKMADAIHGLGKLKS
jgi:hypothetical protein